MTAIIQTIVDSPGAIQVAGTATKTAKKRQLQILLTGGSGRLGRELQKLRKFDYVPTHAELDIADWNSVWNYFRQFVLEPPILIVNAAAYTAVERAELEHDACYQTNVIGVRNLVQTGYDVLQISTSYVYDGTKGNYKEDDAVNPLGYYALTKALAEETVLGGGGKVIRTLFKPRPWPFPKAYDDQITTGFYVDEAAKQINEAIDAFELLPSIVHQGGKRQTILDLALETRSVFRMSRKEVNANLPEDVSLNCHWWNCFSGIQEYGN